MIRMAKNLGINRTTSAGGEKAGDVDARELPDSSYRGRFPPVVVKRVREFLPVLRTDSNAHFRRISARKDSTKSRFVRVHTAAVHRNCCYSLHPRTPLFTLPRSACFRNVGRVVAWRRAAVQTELP